MPDAPRSATVGLAPNDVFRRVRKLYVTCVAIAIPLLFLALITTVNKVGAGVLPILLLIAGIGLLVFALLSRAAASCPRCSASLMWKKGPFGTGRLSIAEKPTCSSCGLDLNLPWSPDTEPAPPEPNESKR